jgi:hypothetical protein
MMLSLFDNERAYMALLHAFGALILLAVIVLMPLGLAARRAVRWVGSGR